MTAKADSPSTRHFQLALPNMTKQNLGYFGTYTFHAKLDRSYADHIKIERNS